jgi:hypothetical protein
MKTDNLIKNLVNASFLILLIGAIFKLQHYPYGNVLTTIGMSSCTMFTTIRIYMLRRHGHYPYSYAGLFIFFSCWVYKIYHLPYSAIFFNCAFFLFTLLFNSLKAYNCIDN